MSLFSFFRRKKRPERVVLTDSSVTRIRPDGMQESVRWDDLVEVGIVTTDAGPWLEDVFWLLSASDGKTGCAVPQEAEGADKLLEALQKLPGFDNEAVIEAMGSTSNARFVCWRKNAQPGAAQIYSPGIPPGGSGATQVPP
jgi:hypothetical protein